MTTALLLIAALQLPPIPPAPPATPGVILPETASVTRWQQAAPPVEYDAGTLSHFIDGGAEVYLDYGFVRAVTADYASGDATITCTVYVMADPQAAFGVFSYFRTGQKAALQIGDAGFGADLQIAFWQDRYYVTIEAFGLDAGQREHLRPFAREIAGRIAKHAAPPEILRRLPAGRVAASEKLLRGRLAANALYTTWPSAALTLGGNEVLLAARYPIARAEATLWLVPFANRGTLDAAWNTTLSRLRPDAGCEAIVPDDAHAARPRRSAKEDPDDVGCSRDGRIAIARRIGNILAIVSGASSREDAAALLDRVRQ